MTHAPIPSRRAVLTLAPALAVVPVPALAADPDAALVALEAEHAALGAECEALEARLDDLQASLPPWPDALRVQPRDWFVSGYAPGTCLIASDVERWRSALANEFHRSCMTAARRAQFEARGAEVIAAWEAHEAATKAAKAVCGYNLVSARDDAANHAHYEVERRIIDTPAAGLTGLRIKARIALAAMGEPDGTYEDHAARAVLADLVREATATA